MVAMMLLPAQSKKINTPMTNCLGNLRQLGTAFQLWADDHDGLFPMAVTATNGGAMEPVAGGDVYHVFKCLSNEISTPNILRCPSDTRIPATNFAFLRDEQVSYFVNLDARTNQSSLLLTGDRNLEVNGKEAGAGVVTISTNVIVGWTRKIHNQSGVTGLADGSAQKFSNSQLQQYLQKTGTNVNRLVFP